MARGEGYELGKLNGQSVITWWEGSGAERRRRRRRLAKGITPAQAAIELDLFARNRTKLLAGEPTTVAELFELYLEDRRHDAKSTGKQGWSWKALAPVFGHLRAGDIDKATCRRFARDRISAGLSAGTPWTDLGVLRAALRWAAKEKHIKSAPFIFLPTPPKPRDRHLTREEAKRLLESTPSPHMQLFAMLALATAGRATALLELEWDRVDFDRNLIDLRTAEQNAIKRRTVIPINASLREMLLTAKAGALTPYVIEWAGGPVLSVKKAFKRAAERAGLEDVTPHTLRHTAAVWMAEAGIPMSVIAQYLGHADSRTTERIYARYSPGYLRQASDALDVGKPLTIEGGRRALPGPLDPERRNET